MIEMMVGVGIMGIFILGLLAVLNNLNTQMLSSKSSLDNETERFNAEALLRQILSQGIDVSLLPGTPMLFLIIRVMGPS